MTQASGRRDRSGKTFWALAAAFLLAQCGPPPVRPQPGKPWHHLQDGFRNPPGSIARTVPMGERWRVMRQIVRRSGSPRQSLPPAWLVPRADARAQLARASAPSISWIGHASFLIRLDGVTILTDPIFSERASPVRFFGPKRLHAPRLTLDDMPPIDMVVISHAHYDHLDMPSLRQLPNKERTLAVVPLGLGRYLADAGFTQIREVDWYEEVRHKGVQLIAYPAVHWANRSPFDVNRTLWMSYAVKGGGQVIYHSGDTEWHDQLFAQIGADMTRRLGACDLALLSVGAYAPRSFMRGAHADPEGAWRIGRAIGCRTMTPMHWGTFVLSLEPVMEPLERFRAAAGEAARLMRIGETQNLAAPPPQIPE